MHKILKNISIRKDSVPWSQLFFYVTLALFLPAPLFPYSSELLPAGGEENTVRTYYQKQLNNLREAVPPRMISLIDAGNYRLYQKLNIDGVLFTYKNIRASQVYFLSDADNYRRHPMIRNAKGVWYFVHVPGQYSRQMPNKKIRYKFEVDGIFEHDETNRQFEDDNQNGFISCYYLTDDQLQGQEGVIFLEQKQAYGQRVLFRIRKEGVRSISLLGDFNQWNSEMDEMKLSENGYYELEKVLPPGNYGFTFKIDGRIQAINSTGQLRYHPAYGSVSYLEIR